MRRANVVQPDAQDSYNTLAKKLGQLSAMLTLSYGDALESIDEMNDDLRQHYYWACAKMAKECGDLLSAIPYPSKEVSRG
jgi:hypothetical protein